MTRTRELLDTLLFPFRYLLEERRFAAKLRAEGRCIACGKHKAFEDDDLCVGCPDMTSERYLPTNLISLSPRQ